MAFSVAGMAFSSQDHQLVTCEVTAECMILQERRLTISRLTLIIYIFLNDSEEKITKKKNVDTFSNDYVLFPSFFLNIRDQNSHGFILSGYKFALLLHGPTRAAIPKPSPSPPVCHKSFPPWLVLPSISCTALPSTDIAFPSQSAHQTHQRHVNFQAN